MRVLPPDDGKNEGQNEGETHGDEHGDLGPDPARNGAAHEAIPAEPNPADSVPPGGDLPILEMRPLVLPLAGKPCSFSLRFDGRQDLVPCRPLRALSRAHGPGTTIVSLKREGDRMPPQRFGAIARHSAEDQGVFFNFCPFCGKSISRNLKNA